MLVALSSHAAGARKFCAQFRVAAQFADSRHRPQTAHLAVPALREKIVEIGGRPTAAGRARTRVLASDLLRERVAEYTCDGRLKVSELRRRAFGNATPADVPEVDYAGVSEEDEMYASGREDGPDEAKLLAARARKAAEWLLAQPPPPTACDAKGWAPREGDVHGRGARRCTLAVVTHQHLLLALTATLGVGDVAETSKRFANAERRAFTLCERPAPDGCKAEL